MWWLLTMYVIAAILPFPNPFVPIAWLNWLQVMAVANAVLGQRAFHLAASSWGSIQSWEAVTDPDLKDEFYRTVVFQAHVWIMQRFAMRKQFSENKIKFFKQMRKSWYIAAFQLPALAPTVWQFFHPEQWRQVVMRLERDQDIPVNPNIRKDGRYGVNLYRANFMPRLLKPRQRYAICPVQAIVLNVVLDLLGAELIDEMPRWVDDFQRVEFWLPNRRAILSQQQAAAAISVTLLISMKISDFCLITLELGFARKLKVWSTPSSIISDKMTSLNFISYVRNSCCNYNHVRIVVGTCACCICLVIRAVTGGLLAGLGLQGTLDAFNNGLGGGAKIALAYGVLGAFALALARSGLPDLFAL